MSNPQWGFAAGCSKITALLSIMHDWFKLSREDKDICAVFLEYREAFHSVPHRTLIDKLPEIINYCRVISMQSVTGPPNST